MIDIHPADLPREADEVRTLLREYADGLGVDLCFQDFESELAALDFSENLLELGDGVFKVLGRILIRFRHRRGMITVRAIRPKSGRLDSAPRASSIRSGDGVSGFHLIPATKPLDDHH